MGLAQRHRRQDALLLSRRSRIQGDSVLSGRQLMNNEQRTVKPKDSKGVVHAGRYPDAGAVLIIKSDAHILSQPEGRPQEDARGRQAFIDPPTGRDGRG